VQAIKTNTGIEVTDLGLFIQENTLGSHLIGDWRGTRDSLGN